MIIFPAIDLKEGKCVRLKQGDFAQKEIFSDDPVKTALKWQEQGGKFLHLVDLDGALTGKPENKKIVAEIVAKLSIPVQLGGGIRSIEYAKEMIEIGVSRIILGTSALQDKTFTEKVLERYGDKVAVSIDAKNGYVAIKGWKEVTDTKAADLANELKNKGLKTIVYTDIAKDGMMQGPNFEELAYMQEKTDLDIIASGGVSSVENIKRLKEMNLYGAIVGKALYTGDIKLEELPW